MCTYYIILHKYIHYFTHIFICYLEKSCSFLFFIEIQLIHKLCSFQVYNKLTQFYVYIYNWIIICFFKLFSFKGYYQILSTVSFVLFLMFSLVFPLFSPFHPLWHVTIVSDLIHASTFSPSLIWSHIYVLYLHMFMGVICLFFILWPLSFAIFLVFLWPLWVLVVAHRIFDLFFCGMWDLDLWPEIEPSTPCTEIEDS